MAEPRSVLFTTDLSEFSWQAFPWALRLARSLATGVDILAVLEHSYTVEAGEGLDRSRKLTVQCAEPWVRARIREKLADLTDEVGQVPVEVHVCIAPTAPTAIVQHAVDQGAEMIVMATHGLTGLARMLVGSTTEQVVRSSRVPVVTVRVAECGCRVVAAPG